MFYQQKIYKTLYIYFPPTSHQAGWFQVRRQAAGAEQNNREAQQAAQAANDVHQNENRDAQVDAVFRLSIELFHRNQNTFFSAKIGLTLEITHFSLFFIVHLSFF